MSKESAKIYDGSEVIENIINLVKTGDIDKFLNPVSLSDTSDVFTFQNEKLNDIDSIPSGTKCLHFPPFCGEYKSLRDIIPHLPNTLEEIDFAHEGITVDDERDDGTVTSLDDLEELYKQCPRLKKVLYCGYYSDVSEKDWKTWSKKHMINVCPID